MQYDLGALGPVDQAGPWEMQSTCSPTAKPGVVAFAAWVTSQLGGKTINIVRPCEVGGRSEHKEGRAWDWGVRADSEADAAKAKALLDWLTLPDAQGVPAGNARRAGILYIIWDRQIWNVRDQAWKPYSGASAHTDHVHFSFTWPGARAETTFYKWLGLARPTVAGGLSGLGMAATAAIGFGVGFQLFSGAVRRWGR